MANEEEIARLVIRLVADVKDVKTQLASVQGTVKGTTDAVEKSAQGFSASIAGIKASYLGAVAAMYAAYQSVAAAINWMEVGAKAQQTEEAFAALTKSLGVNGEAMIDSMRKVGYVFVESTGLMLKSQRLLVEGISSADIVGLTEASRVAARLMGVDVTEAFNRITEAAITMRTRGLKAAFPMDLSKVTEDYAKSLGTVTKYLSEAGQRQAIVNEILRQSVEKKGLLGTILEPTTAEQMQRVSDAWGEMKEQIGKVLADLVKGSNLLPGLIDAFQSIGDAAKAIGDSKDDIADVMSILQLAGRTIGLAFSSVLMGFKTLWFGILEINYSILEIANTLTLGAIPAVSKALEDAGKKKDKLLEGMGKDSERLLAMMAGEKFAPSEKKKVATGVADKEAAKKALIDQKKLDDDLKKFRLENEVARIAAQADMVKAGLDRQKVMELNAAEAAGQSKILVNLKWDRILLEQDLQSTKQGLAIRQKAEVDAAVLGGMDKAAVEGKFAALRLAAEAKYRAGIAKVDADFDAYERKMRTESLASEEERLNLRNQIVASKLDAQRTIALEAARREGKDVAAEEIRWDGVVAAETLRASKEDLAAREKIDLDAAREKGQSRLDVEIHYIQLRQDAEAKYNADMAKGESAAAEHRRELAAQAASDTAAWNEQIAEATGNYDALTNAQLQGLQVEEDNYIASKRWGELELEQQAQYLYAMELRKKKLQEVRELEKAAFVADYGSQLAELGGDWDKINDAQIKAIESQRAYLLATAGTNQEMKDLVNQVANLKIKQAEARANWDFQATNSLSVQKKQVDYTNQLADIYGTAVVSSVNAAGDALGNFLNNLKSVRDGSMSLGDAFTKLGEDFASAVQKMIIEVLVLIAKMYILKALQAGTALGGAAEGGGLVGMQTGGPVRGPSGRDRVPIRATAGEFIHKVAAVRYYGIEAMQAINAQRVPRSAFAGLVGGGASRPSFALAAGGSVPAVASGDREGSKVDLTMINVSDPRDLDKYLSSAAGQNAVLNVISSRADSIKKVLR